MTSFKEIILSFIRYAPIAIALALLSSCTSPEKNFNEALPLLKESPSARALAVEKCMTPAFEPEVLDQLAFYVKVPRSEVMRTACQRMVNGFASGKIAYKDFKAIYRKKMLTPAFVDVLKGR